MSVVDLGKTLVVVCGSTSSGKSVFIKSIKATKVEVSGVRLSFADYRRIDAEVQKSELVAIEILDVPVGDERKLLSEIANDHGACLFVVSMLPEKTTR